MAGAARRLGWAALAVVLLVWAFVLGLLVGQGSLLGPEQMAWLRSQAAAVPVVGAWFDRGPAEREATLTQPRLSFYKTLERTGREAGPDQPAEQAKDRPAAKKPAPAEQRKHQAEPKRKQAPPQKKAAEPAAPQPGQGRYTVQVASLNDQGQADAMAMRLRAAGLPAYVRKAQVQGVGVRYRVRVGAYDDLDQAQGAAGRIRLQQRLAAYVTRVD